MVILIYGLPGSGKTTIARLFSQKIKCPMISSEEVRSFIYEEENVADDKDFSSDELHVSYNTIFLISKYIIENDMDIVIEGVFRSNEQRIKISNLAKQYKTEFISILLQSDKDIALDRLTKRKMGTTVSPCGPKTLDSVAATFELPTIEENSIVVNNNGLINTTLDIILDQMTQRGIRIG